MDDSKDHSMVYPHKLAQWSISLTVGQLRPYDHSNTFGTAATISVSGFLFRSGHEFYESPQSG